MAARNDYDERSRIMVTEVRAPKTAELVAAHLRRRIVRGELKEGDALPPETVLLGQFGVSRPTLREAFRVLEAELLISVRRGARGGARVHTPNVDVAARYAGLVLEHRGTTLADIYEARNIIEPPCAGLLARRRTPEQLRRLWEEVERAEAVIDEPNRLIRIHTEFHALIVDFSGNQTMRVLSGMLRHIIDTAHWERLAEDAGSPSERRAIHRDVREHRRVVELIEAGDAEAAEALWRKHLVEAADRLTSGPTATTVLDLLG